MKFLMLLLSLGLSIATSSVQALEAGKDYAELSPTQKTSAPKGQVEVLEFFWYGCPHCNALEPDLNDWLKNKPKHVAFKRVPAILNESWAAMARAYYALEALGKNDKLHSDVFHAFHVQRMDLSPPETFFDWAVTKSIDRKKLADAYNSFAVNTKVMRAAQLTRDYKLAGVPALAVNGKYVTSVSMTGSQQALFDTVDVLIAQEFKRK